MCDTYLVNTFLGGVIVIHSKVTRGGQITISKTLREEVGIEEGDYVELIRVPEGILLKPKKMQLVDLNSLNQKN